MLALNKKLLADRKSNVIFLTHFMAPHGDKGRVVYNAALNKLGKFGQIISLESSRGVWCYRNNGSVYDNSYNEISFALGSQRPIEKYNWPFILKTLTSESGTLNIKPLQDEIMDKNLFFSGYSLYCCVRNTIFSAAPVAAIKDQSQTFTLLKDYLWAEIVTDNHIHGQALQMPDGYFWFYDKYLEIPAYPILKKLLMEYYVHPPVLREREIVQKVYDYYGINLFFHYAGEEYPLYASRQNKLRIDLDLR
jgi:hypothetical protein